MSLIPPSRTLEYPPLHYEWHGQGIDTSTVVRVSVLPVREIETKMSGRVYAAAQGVHGREGYVIRRHGCALAGSDNSRVVVPTSSYQRELPEYKALLLICVRIV
jgi:hypothetical protein